jgi:HlyD family secretion protein
MKKSNLNNSNNINLIESLKELFLLLTPQQKKNFFILQFLVILSSFFELFGVTLVVPFMKLIGSLEILHNQKTIFYKIYTFFSFSSDYSFILFLGVFVILILGLSSFFSIFTIWKLYRFANKTGMELADLLYKHYMIRNWLFYVNNNSAELTKQIANEAARVTNLMLQPIMNINAKLVLIFVISLTIILYNYKVAFIGITFFSISYFVMYKVVRKKLHINGERISNILTNRYRLLNEGFGGIKDILLTGTNIEYIKKFEKTGEIFANAQSVNITISQAPRYIMEFVTYGSMILLVLYLFNNESNNIQNILPTLTFYALASFKLLPAFQQIYVAITHIKGNVAAFNVIKEDLKEALNESKDIFLCSSNTRNKLSMKRFLKLNNINFKYPNSREFVLQNISMRIEANTLIGIVGHSGSGKSTLVDIILGLIFPNSGEIIVDNKIINKNNVRLWQNNIGYVNQSIFLSEGTIAENIAFGIPADKIDFNKINEAVKLAHLSEMIDKLELGIYTKVGERGVKLSGGQRQRIAIARALYNNPDILIFDEATSALDGITEKIIMDAIHKYKGKKTIIIVAHRLKTIKKCDKIFLLDKGIILDEGKYDELIKKSKLFYEMASHA